MGMLLRIIYAIRVPYDISPHDLGPAPGEGKDVYGHLGYIYYLYQHHSLSWIIRRQFYHPPLFHILAASVFDIAVLFGADTTRGFEWVQLFNTCIAGGCTLVMFWIFKKLPIHRLLLIPAAALTALFPSFYILGTEINNDCLMTFFSLLCLYALLLWGEEPDGKHFFLVAAFFICTVWTKWSGILLAPVVLSVLVWILWDRRRYLKRFLIYLPLFFWVVLPLAMGWMWYLTIGFRVPLYFIPHLPDGDRQYVGALSPLERLLPAPLWELSTFRTDLADGDAHGRIWRQTLLTAVFDEGILSDPNPLLGWVLLWAVYICGLIGMICAVRLIFDSGVGALYRILLPVGYFTLLVGYACYCFSNPFISAVNFRYIPGVLAYGWGATWVVLSAWEGIVGRVMRWVVAACVLVIGVETTLLYAFYL